VLWQGALCPELVRLVRAGELAEAYILAIQADHEEHIEEMEAAKGGKMPMEPTTPPRGFEREEIGKDPPAFPMPPEERKQSPARPEWREG
jgi:hypothetical protein